MSENPTVRQVLLVSFSNIGDAVLSMPVLDRLVEHYCPAAVDVIVGPRARVVFEKDTRIRNLLTYDKSGGWIHRLRFFWKLRKIGYDVVVDLRNTYFSFLGKKNSGLFVRSASSHKRDTHLAKLRGLGIPSRRLLGRLPAGPEDTSVAARFAVEADGAGPLIVMAPGARSHLKQWPKERFAALADRLVSHQAARIIWIGDVSEIALIEEIRALTSTPSWSVAGRAAWAESTELIRRATLVITNDSAPLHAADHAGRRVLCFFGPTDPGKYGPQNSPEGVLFRGKFCQPCESARCRYHHECMNEISVDEAYKKALVLLARSMGLRGIEPAGLKALVVRLDRMGDMLLTFPAFAAIRRKFADASLTVLALPHTRILAERSPDVTDVMAYDYKQGGVHRRLCGYFRLVRELRRRRFDVAFVAHPTLRSHLLCFLAGIPIRCGYRAEAGRLLLTRSIPDRRNRGFQHESQYVMDVLRLFGVEPVDTPPRFHIFAEDEREARALLAARGIGQKKYVVIHPFSSSRSKEWPPEHFAKLAGRLRDSFSLSVVVVGAEYAEAAIILKRELGESCVELIGRTSPPVLATLMRDAEIVVTNDSGPAHLAAAAGARVLSIFGRNAPGLGPTRWKPLGKNARYAHKDPGCVVCLAEECTIGFECLKALLPEEVFALAAKMLDTAPSDASRFT